MCGEDSAVPGVQQSRQSRKARRLANTQPGSKFERPDRCDRSTAPLACGIGPPGITHPAASYPQKDTNGSDG